MSIIRNGERYEPTHLTKDIKGNLSMTVGCETVIIDASTLQQFANTAVFSATHVMTLIHADGTVELYSRGILSERDGVFRILDSAGRPTDAMRADRMGRPLNSNDGICFCILPVAAADKLYAASPRKR